MRKMFVVKNFFYWSRNKKVCLVNYRAVKSFPALRYRHGRASAQQNVEWRPNVSKQLQGGAGGLRQTFVDYNTLSHRSRLVLSQRDTSA